MAKLPRVFQRIFGSSAGVDQIAQFGSLFAGSSAFTTDPSVAQSLSNWLTGWFAAAIGGNAPAIEDMNAVLFVITYQLAQMFQDGVPAWDTSTTYYIGSLVQDGNGVIFKSLTDNNQGNALTSNSNWKKAQGQQTVRDISTSTSISPNDNFLVCDAGAGTLSLTLPDASTVPGQTYYVKKVDSSANPVSLNASAGQNIDGDTSNALTTQYESRILVSDGVSSWSIF